MENLFLRLSAALSGLPNVRKSDADEYVSRLKDFGLGDKVDGLLTEFKKLLDSGDSDSEAATKLAGSDELRPIVAQVILIWLTSTLQDTSATAPTFINGTQNQYFEAPVWDLIGAHAPGLSGGYFGHWRYPPENAPSGDGR